MLKASDRAHRVPIPHVHRGAPFAQMVPRRCGDPDHHTHTVCVLHLDRWPEFARVLPHITGRMHGGKQQTWRSSK